MSFVPVLLFVLDGGIGQQLLSYVLQLENTPGIEHELQRKI